MNLPELKNQLNDLRKKETIAQTREQLLNEEKDKLLSEISSLLIDINKLEIFSSEELTTSNLKNIIEKLGKHIEEEISKSNLPPELS